MKKNILSFMKKHELISKCSTVLVGVSGGPDSMALLHFLRSIREEWNLRIIAVSIDHQLRGEEAHADLLYVEEQCKKWHIEFVGRTVNVPQYKLENHIGTQVAARELRYQMFKEQMQAFQADYLALGHHGDDQVETMLMNLVRLADSSAFSGIPVKRAFKHGFIVRPLLCLTKAEIESYCIENHIYARMDPSNDETDYTRNYFRKNILPIIKDKNGNIHKTVQRLSETKEADEDYLENVADQMFLDVVTYDGKEKKACFEIDMFKSRALALQRRTFHLILKYLYNKLPENLSYAHEDHFFALLENKGNARIDFPCKLKVEKSYQQIRFYFQHQVSEHPVIPGGVLNVPGEIVLHDGSILSAVYTDEPIEQDEHSYLCTTESIAMPLHIRARQAGDRMSWKGLEGTKKVKDIFIDAKIPRKERDTWPLVTDNNGEILWLVGLKKRQLEIQATEAASYIQLNFSKAAYRRNEHA